MRHLRILALGLAALIVAVACDSSGVAPTSEKSSSSESNQEAVATNVPLPSSSILGSSYTEVLSERTEGKRVFERADGKRVVSVIADRAQNVSKSQTEDANTGTRSVYKYDGSSYDGSTTDLVGKMEDRYDNLSGETFRTGVSFYGFDTETVETVTEISYRLTPLPYEDYQGQNSSRSGRLVISNYDGDPKDIYSISPQESDYEALADGAQLQTYDVEVGETNKVIDETYTSGSLFDAISNDLESGEPQVGLGFFANDESSSGLAFRINQTILTVVFEEPTEAAPSDSPPLYSPDDNSVIRQQSVTLDWGSVDAFPDVDDYVVQLDTDPNFGSPETKSPTSTQASFSGLNYNTTYYWKVKARNSVGDGPFSRVIEFEVLPPLLDVSIDGPNGRTSSQSGTWTADVTGGIGTTSYSWSVKRVYDSSFYSVSGGSSLTYTFGHSEQTRREAFVRVTVTKGRQTETTTKKIYIYANEDDACKSSKIVAC